VSSSTSLLLIDTGLSFDRRRLPHLRLGAVMPPFHLTPSWRTQGKLYFVVHLTVEQVHFKIAQENNNNNNNNNKRKHNTRFKTTIAVDVTLCLLAAIIDNLQECNLHL
jgi:hypothetical protein